MRRRRARRRARAATAAARPPRRPRPGPSAPHRTAPHRPTPASRAAPPHTCSRCFHRVPLGAYNPPLSLPLRLRPRSGRLRQAHRDAPRRLRGALGGRPLPLGGGRRRRQPARSVGAARSNKWSSWRCHVGAPPAPQTDWVRRLGAALCTRERRSGTSDPTEGPCSRNQPALHDTDSQHRAWPSRWGGTPLDDAMRSKHALVANYLRTKGGLSGQEIRSRAEAETRGSGWFR